MSKGPVGLLQSVVPMAVFGVYQRLLGDEGARRARTNLAAIGGGALVMLAIALPWPVSVLMTVPNAAHLWVQDVFAPPGTEQRVGHWWGYVNLLPNLLPWVPLFAGGLCLPFLKRFRGRRAMMAWLLFIVPVIVMSFVRDKNERYGMPMVPAAAILSGFLAVAFVRNRAEMTWSDRLAENLQWIVGFAMAGAIVAGAMSIQGTPPFYSWTVAIVGVSAALGTMLIALVARRRAPWLAVAGPAAVSLIVYHIAMLGYLASPGGQSEYRPLAMRAQAEYPEAELLFYDGGIGRHVPTDLAIYAGHIVRNVKEEALSQGSDREQVLFAIQNADEPVRQFDGWTFVTSEVAERRRGSLYVRKP